MKQIFLFLALGFSLITTGCAIGPLTGHESARTVGDGRHEIVGGYGQSGFLVKWNYGLAESWDIGFHGELFSLGIRTKYAFLNPERGFALALTAGIGESFGGDHYYGEALMSYKWEVFEPYFTYRYVRVETDPVEFNDEDSGTADFKVNSYKFTYAQYILGTRIWFNDHWVFTLEGARFGVTTDGFEVISWNQFSGSLGYKF